MDKIKNRYLIKLIVESQNIGQVDYLDYYDLTKIAFQCYKNETLVSSPNITRLARNLIDTVWHSFAPTNSIGKLPILTVRAILTVIINCYKAAIDNKIFHHSELELIEMQLSTVMAELLDQHDRISTIGYIDASIALKDLESIDLVSL